MTLTFAQVWHASLGGLKAALDDWSAMAGRLEDLAQDARDTLLARSEQARWEGVNASVTRAFVAKSVRESGDAASAARGMGQLLDDGYATLKAAQDGLHQLVEIEAPAASLTVSEAGGVAALRSVTEDPARQLFDPEYSAHFAAEREAVAAMQRRVDVLVERFDDADRTLARALLADADEDRHDFGAPVYTTLDQEELAQALLLAREGDRMTSRELEQFNELLADNRDSPEFTTGLFRELGAEGTLTLFGSLSMSTMGEGYEVDEHRLEQVQALQRNLGLGLATATDPDNGHHLPASFGEELRRLGTERLPLTAHAVEGPYGYQLLGGILRYGAYDPAFLTPIAEHVVQLHADDPLRFADARQGGAGPEHPFNPVGANGAGYDPVLGVLEALGHSPEAATQFFSTTPTAYREDGSLDPDGHAGILRGGDSPVAGYLDYFLQEGYTQFPDVNSHDPAAAAGQSADHLSDALGHALEAATLGHAWDETSVEVTRSEAGAGVMEDIADRFSRDPGLSHRFSALTDSLGNMAAGYVDDINWALDGGEGSAGPFAPEWNDVSLHARFGNDVQPFLSVLGQHPDSYATLSQAERIYTASVLDAQVGADGTVEEGPARNVVRITAQAQGFLDQARADQVRAEGLASDEAFNRALDERSGWLKYGAATAVAGGAAFLPAAAAGAIVVPLAVTAGSGAVNEWLGQLVGDWTRSDQQSSQDEIQEAGARIYSSGYNNLATPLVDFMLRQHVNAQGDLGQSLRESLDIGYNFGTSGEGQVGIDAQVGGGGGR
ncbi:hypothetical protein ACL02R_15400 [Streptomyces sp. MS19]|uniref:hypothetical protein n=1 Tax=Streptomyces sp. MS19 TaxID=3385972 RepID=UPI0039A22DFD